MTAGCEDRSEAALEKLPFVFRGDFHSTMRLNFQHFIQRRQYGYLLHPAIPIDSEDLRIADVGAGTCIWLIELADGLPSSVKLDAFDITPEQYPPRTWLPENISLYVQDAFKAFPKEFHGLYDIVHVALFVLIVQDNDPSVLISNLLQLLKPGGYLQWNEVDTSSRRIIRPESSTAVTPAIDELEAYLQRRSSGRPPDWPAKLDATFTEQGLVKSTLDRYPVIPAYRAISNQNVLLLWEDMSRHMDERDPSIRSGKGAELRRLLARVAEEFHQGSSMVTDLVVAVGRSRESARVADQR